MKRLLVVLLLLTPVALPGLAHASPPDPSWIQGFYDDGDRDDVVSRITSGTGHAPATTTPTDLPFLARPGAQLIPTPERMPLGLWATGAPPRAPPAP